MDKKAIIKIDVLDSDTVISVDAVSRGSIDGMEQINTEVGE